MEKELIKMIFEIEEKNEFEELALKVFYFQAKNNIIYQQYINALNVSISSVRTINQIPFLPISFFKNHKITTGDFIPERVFTSSGTTGMTTSKHYVKKLSVYEESMIRGFQLFFGKPSEYVLLALLPSYLERTGSSLVYMTDKLIQLSEDTRSGFYLHNYESLYQNLQILKKQNKKTILLGVTYALLDMVEQFDIDFPDLIVMETGGMKGNRKEMVKEELHNKLKSGFGVEKIYSEYGMTELLSQAYSYGRGVFQTPPWMKILIRDVNDPLNILPVGHSGGINIIDLANLHSCSFIATQDLGKTINEDQFEILGRFDNSDVRGCNLLMQ